MAVSREGIVLLACLRVKAAIRTIWTTLMARR